jgi:uncharacterized integral membrane protein
MTYEPEPRYQPPAAPPDWPGDQPQPPVAPITPPTNVQPTPGLDSHGRVKGTRFSALWVGLIVAAILLIALLVFIAQNLRRVTIHFLGFHGQISLAIALVLSAVIGLLLIAIPGTARILQLRRALKRSSGT